MTFWQVPFDGEELEFRLQADNLTPSSIRKVKRLLKGWDLVAHGWDRKYELMVFNKMFQDRDQARKFVDEFPEDLIVKGYNGKDIAHF